MAEISFDQLEQMKQEFQQARAPSVEMLAGEQQAFRARGGFAENLSRAAGGMVDQLGAAAQGTSPIVRDMQGQDIRPFRGRFFQDALGPSFIDEQGQVQPVNPNTMVILPDPTTRELMVFDRTEDTNERVLSAARLFGLGALTSTAPRLATQAAVEGRATAEVARSEGVSRETAGILRRSAVPEDIKAVQKAAEDAMPADAPSLQPVLDEVVQRPGRTQIAVQRLAARADKAQQDITKALDNAFGEPLGVESSRRGIVEAGRENRNRLYEVAYAQPIDYASETGLRLQNMLRDQVPTSALTRANALIRESGERGIQEILLKLDPKTGEVSGFEALPNVRQIDFITRALRDLARGEGVLGGKTDLGGVRSKNASQIRGLLRELVPEYGRALDNAAQDIRAVEALNRGREVLRRNVTRDELATELADMSQAERNWLMTGIRSQIDETLANVTVTLQNPDAEAQAIREAARAVRDLSSRANREKTALIIGPTQAERLFNQIDQAGRTFVLQGAVARNSATAARTLVRSGIQGAAQRGENVLELAGEGSFGAAAGRVVRGTAERLGAGGLFGPGREAREAAVSADLADILTRQGGLGGAVSFENITLPRVATEAGPGLGRGLQGAAAAQQGTTQIRR